MEKKFANLGTMLSRAQAKKVGGGTTFDTAQYCPTGAACNTTSGAYFGAGDYPHGSGFIAIVSGYCICVEGTNLSYVPPTNMC
jgi:hypothetical protein